MSLSVYILTDPLNEPYNRYKVGSHKGTLNSLKTRYRTALPNLIVRYFIETNNAKIVEDQFKTTYQDKRVLNDNGNKSEWVIMLLDDIFNAICAIICKNKNQIVMNGKTNIVTFNEVTSNNSILDKANTIDFDRTRKETASKLAHINLEKYEKAPINYMLGKIFYEPANQVLVIIGNTKDTQILFFKINATNMGIAEKIIDLADKGAILKQDPITDDEIKLKITYDYLCTSIKFNEIK